MMTKNALEIKKERYVPARGDHGVREFLSQAWKEQQDSSRDRKEKAL